MTTRRDFLKTTAAATAVAAFAGAGQVMASGTAPYAGVVYTKDNPGKWAQKVGSHAPKVTVASGKAQIVTEHGQSEKHFIVRHTLVQEDGTFIGAKTFSPADKPESTFDIPAGYKGKLYATSFCNLHDFWLTELSV